MTDDPESILVFEEERFFFGKMSGKGKLLPLVLGSYLLLAPPQTLKKSSPTVWRVPRFLFWRVQACAGATLRL